MRVLSFQADARVKERKRERAYVWLAYEVSLCHLGSKSATSLAHHSDVEVSSICTEPGVCCSLLCVMSTQGSLLFSSAAVSVVRSTWEGPFPVGLEGGFPLATFIQSPDSRQRSTGFFELESRKASRIYGQQA